MRYILILCMALSVNLIAQNLGRSKVLPPECKKCHSCDQPTKMNPCLEACPREHMITVHHTPQEGPDVVVIDQFGSRSDLYKKVMFSHRAHAEMSGMGGDCQICHHYNPPGNILPCRECHELTRQREDIKKPDLKGAYHRQCISCHREWSGEVECVSCHAPEGEPEPAEAALRKPAAVRVHPTLAEPVKLIYETDFDDGKIVTFLHDEHTDLFGLACNDCHQNESCSKCHMKQELKPVDLSVESKHLLCSKCHDTEDKCEYCHRTTEIGPFDHASRTGFSLVKYHSGLKCDKCHLSKRNFSGLSSGCNNCHENWNPGNFKHEVTGLTLDETHREFECDNCHVNVYSDKPACDNCHDEDIVFPDSVPGKLNVK